MTKIEWAQNLDGSRGRTWNPTTGCDKTSPGCTNCYAMGLAKRLKAMGQAKYQNDGDPITSGPGFGLTVHPDALDVPLHVRKPTTWFVNSMSDLFHPDVPGDFIRQVFGVMTRADRHTFQVLTKRSKRMRQLLALPSFWYMIAEEPPPNWWQGVSVETDRYTFRVDHLRATDCQVRFLSLEPLLGPLPSLDLTDIHWVIVGAESGHGARPMDDGWVRDIRDQCVQHGIPFFLKQRATPGGRKISLPELDGQRWAQMPAPVGA